MEGDLRKDGSYHQLLGLMSKERGWLVRDGGSLEEKKLELRLGPPGGDWSLKENGGSTKERDESSHISLGYFPKVPKNNTNPCAGAKRAFLDTVEAPEKGAVNDNNCGQNQKLSSQNPGVLFPPPWPSSSPSSSTFSKSQQQKPAFMQFQSIPTSMPVMAKESAQANGTKVELQSHERKADSANAAGVNNTQTRTASVPVVGWPPVRSFRKNLASSSSKPPPDSQTRAPEFIEKPDNCKKGLFVKINMDGVPIGRKVDLKAYDSYEKLSRAVDELFRCLLAAQRDSPAAGNQTEEVLAITGLLDGTGEYTLVYEDNEGDRMLVGDVPWDMFVTTVKRLRVLKSSELSTLCLGGNRPQKTPPDSRVR